ncbi:P-type conjugative transfer protein TrbJ [Croceicoccus naphthovorans]|uniref:Conjugal transfer protein TrbJ n=1 Tax=Croceicoccus naphthovorans TaxID=1348774 RepID=A0A0G3XHR3_9SPHN|nr:P-type conjugative transfer protein TrbJ [Croceicoccus naphthovorans]AKM11060.1 conjugal transfer protein TrbJ [Croceicoccus naphthovorans]MBB3989503.1 P-type conjugative transfer protein TrbJ [Croceicoccus naphthovorans]UBS33887.1 P-type conjugative transfer protein TrbJ [Altererythrobacter sp. N1]
MTRHSLRRSLIAGIAVLGLTTVSVPANAQLGFGGIVYDPTNYAQNVLTAARSLQQINNQIQQIQQQATSLVNEARNLASLPFSSLNELQTQIQQTRQLMSEAQRIAYDVQTIEDAFTARYRGVDMSASDATLIANARERWRDSVGSFEDALRVQAGVVGNIEGSQTAMANIVGASQSATGALQVAQAGNQLLALQTQQIADLTALIAAQSRAQALESARNAATEEQGREHFRRFMRRSGQ